MSVGLCHITAVRTLLAARLALVQHVASGLLRSSGVYELIAALVQTTLGQTSNKVLQQAGRLELWVLSCFFLVCVVTADAAG